MLAGLGEMALECAILRKRRDLRLRQVLRLCHKGHGPSLA